MPRRLRLRRHTSPAHENHIQRSAKETFLRVPLSYPKEQSSETWTTSSEDTGPLPDANIVRDWSYFLQEYNRLAQKHGIRSIIPDDFATNPESRVARARRPSWFARTFRKTSTLSQSVIEAPDRKVPLRRSISDIALNLIHHRHDGLKDEDLQSLIRLCGKSVLYLPPEYSPGSLVLPTCFRATTQYLVQYAPLTRGVFRIPGSVRVVAALYNYYCAEQDADATASTVRGPNLPTHVNAGVHDVASTFKKLLAGLPGGILGSLALFDALVAIQSQLLGEAELNRTKQSKLRARLIALSIGTVKSYLRQELICAVFGLLTLIGRTAEMAPREDERGRPLPTSDLMGYNALGVVFGPLLVGDLIDSYSMKIANPTAGLVLLPVTPPKSRRYRRKSRAADEPNTNAALTVDKIHVANSIAEMVITHWREVVKHLKSMQVLKFKRKPSRGTNSTPRSIFLRSSVSEPCIANGSAQFDRFPNGQTSFFGDDASISRTTTPSRRGSTTSQRWPDGMFQGQPLNRQRPRSYRVGSVRRLSGKTSLPILSPTVEETNPGSPKPPHHTIPFHPINNDMMKKETLEGQEPHTPLQQSTTTPAVETDVETLRYPQTLQPGQQGPDASPSILQVQREQVSETSSSNVSNRSTNSVTAITDHLEQTRSGPSKIGSPQAKGMTSTQEVPSSPAVLDLKPTTSAPSLLSTQDLPVPTERFTLSNDVGGSRFANDLRTRRGLESGKASSLKAAGLSRAHSNPRKDTTAQRCSDGSARKVAPTELANKRQAATDAYSRASLSSKPQNSWDGHQSSDQISQPGDLGRVGDLKGRMLESDIESMVLETSGRSLATTTGNTTDRTMNQRWKASPASPTPLPKTKQPQSSSISNLRKLSSAQSASSVDTLTTARNSTLRRQQYGEGSAQKLTQEPKADQVDGYAKFQEELSRSLANITQRKTFPPSRSIATLRNVEPKTPTRRPATIAGSDGVQGVRAMAAMFETAAANVSAEPLSKDVKLLRQRSSFTAGLAPYTSSTPSPKSVISGMYCSKPYGGSSPHMCSSWAGKTQNSSIVSQADPPRGGKAGEIEPAKYGAPRSSRGTEESDLTCLSPPGTERRMDVRDPQRRVKLSIISSSQLSQDEGHISRQRSRSSIQPKSVSNQKLNVPWSSPYGRAYDASIGARDRAAPHEQEISKAEQKPPADQALITSEQTHSTDFQNQTLEHSASTERGSRSSSIRFQTQNLQKPPEARADEGPQLRGQPSSQDNPRLRSNTIDTLREQLRAARQECAMWRQRAEAAERRVAMFERFTARLRRLREQGRTIDFPATADVLHGSIGDAVPRPRSGDGCDDEAWFEGLASEGKVVYMRASSCHSSTSAHTEDGEIVTARVHPFFHGMDGATSTCRTSSSGTAEMSRHDSVASIWMAAQEMLEHDEMRTWMNGQ